jgi:hypothetical protein
MIVFFILLMSKIWTEKFPFTFKNEEEKEEKDYDGNEGNHEGEILNDQKKEIGQRKNKVSSFWDFFKHFIPLIVSFEKKYWLSHLGLDGYSYLFYQRKIISLLFLLMVILIFHMNLAPLLKSLIEKHPEYSQERIILQISLKIYQEHHSLLFLYLVTCLSIHQITSIKLHMQKKYFKSFYRPTPRCSHHFQEFHSSSQILGSSYPISIMPKLINTSEFVSNIIPPYPSSVTHNSLPIPLETQINSLPNQLSSKRFSIDRAIKCIECSRFEEYEVNLLKLRTVQIKGVDGLGHRLCDFIMEFLQKEGCQGNILDCLVVQDYSELLELEKKRLLMKDLEKIYAAEESVKTTFLRFFKLIKIGIIYLDV